MTGDTARAPAVRLALLMADGDGLIVEADDAAVGDGNPEHVTDEIVDHGLLAFAPGGAVHDPGFGPSGRGRCQVGTALGQRGLERGQRTNAGLGLDWNEEAVALLSNDCSIDCCDHDASRSESARRAR